MKEISMKNAIKMVVMAVLAMGLSGCMWSRMKVNDPTIADRALAIKPGVTKGEEIAGIIGAQPTMRMPGKDYALFGYTYADTKVNGLMLLVFNFMRSTTVTDTLYIQVDRNTGVVTDVYLPKKHEVEWRFWPFGE